MSYKGLLLDLDNTLYPYKPAHNKGMENVFATVENDFGLDLGQFQESFSIARKQLHSVLKNTASSHSRVIYFKHALEHMGEYEEKRVLKLKKVYWETFFDFMDLFPGALDFLKQTTHLKKGLVTNLTTEIQLKKIAHLGIGEHFDFVLTSEEVGVEKPAPAIFNEALARMNLNCNELAMIGDDYKADIEGALVAGMGAYWLNQESTGDVPEVNIFKDFSQLLEQLK